MKESHSLQLAKCETKFEAMQITKSPAQRGPHAFSFRAHSLAAEGSRALAVRKGSDGGHSLRESQASQPPEKTGGGTFASPKKTTHLSSTAASHR